jgi:hypothetical protein
MTSQFTLAASVTIGVVDVAVGPAEALLLAEALAPSAVG